MTPRHVLAVAGVAILTVTPAVAAPARKQAKTLTVPAYTMPWLIDRAADYYRAQGIDVPAYRVTSARLHGAAGNVDFNGPIPVIQYNPDEMSRADDADTALHEVAHVIQGADHIYSPTTTMEWVEGQAATVTADQLCPFMAQTWGRAVAYAECRIYPAYQGYTNMVRAYSARATGTAWMSPTARRYRLDQLRTLRRNP